ncbi:MAG: NAD-dependent epimerase/dehydratase family protein [Candidatus Obscuribacter sp.]|nr:NAD-dependent epimerase/dehydratase family protein [Candidatus Obscuribacter sp.]
MRTLVIGGNGFIGTNLVDHLLASGHQVRVFDRYPNRFRGNTAGVEYLSGDIGNQGEMEEAVRGMEWVFHLAIRLYLRHLTMIHFMIFIPISQAQCSSSLSASKQKSKSLCLSLAAAPYMVCQKKS